MALPININDLITCRTVESERIEFKEGWNPEEVIHTLCAFANDINNWGGGYIVIGVQEKDGRPVLPPVGLKAPSIDKIQKELLNLCNRLKPHYFPVAEPVLFQKKHIFIIWAPGGQNRPYQAPVSLGKGSPYAYYVRRFSNTVKAKLDEERELMELAANVPFDDRINHKAEINDIKLSLIQSFLQEIGSSLYDQSVHLPFSQICEQMKIVDGPPEYLKPRNVGLMFFNERPHDFFPYSRIELVHFKTSPADNEMSEKIFDGPVHQQVRNALSYIKDSFIVERVRKVPGQAEAIRFYNYPYEAIEEALVNAVYHRSYEIREPVEVRIHPDRIEILSFPGPDRSVKQEDMEKGVIVSRRYRNRRIGEFLKELDLTEGKATGIPKMKKAMKRNGSPEPVFQTDDERSYFLSILPIHTDFPISEQVDEQAIEPDENELNQLIEEIKEQVREQDREQVKKQVFRVLEYCKSPRTRQEIFKQIGINPIYKNFKRRILPIVNKGFLEMTIPDKPQSSKQQYRITAKGTALLGRKC